MTHERAWITKSILAQQWDDIEAIGVEATLAKWWATYEAEYRRQHARS